MRWIEAAFKTSSEALDGLCDKLLALGAEGLVIEDEADFRRFLEENRQYWDYVDEELEQRYRGVSRVKLYVSEDAEGRAKLAKFTEAAGCEPDLAIVDDADWLESYKQYYKPLEIGQRLLVVPSWEPVPDNSGRLPLILDPGLAFGTGSHATTRMCLELLETVAKPGKRALDLGCGSGILGIGALILGCDSVLGCDVDPKAPETAQKNAALNGIGAERFNALAGDIIRDGSLRRSLGAGWDIVLANIVADVIIPLAPSACELIAPNGVFICSGIIDGREREVIRALEAAGFEVVTHKRQETWSSMLCKPAACKD